MKLATLNNGQRDGQLVVVSRDLRRALPVPGIAATLQQALEQWENIEPLLVACYNHLNNDPGTPNARDFDPHDAMAPLPRAYQWLDGSAFSHHGTRMQQAFGTPPLDTTLPLMYQGGSDDFLGPTDAACFPDASYGIDIEGELAVVTGDVPMGTRQGSANQHIRLLMLLNDWSLRTVQKREMSLGFGFVHTKPSTAFSPVAVTLDELGADWRDSRAHVRLTAHINGRWLGHPDAGGMEVGFDRLIEHAATTRCLRAGTIIGSGTVSQADDGVGAVALSEVRAAEKISTGQISTNFLQHGDRVRLEVFDAQGQSLFGAIEQEVCCLA
jgi:fumarylacetoacetate (FAA) hydrolase